MESFVCDFVVPFHAANPGIRLERISEGFQRFVFAAHTSTYNVCACLCAWHKQAIMSCDARNTKHHIEGVEELDLCSEEEDSVVVEDQVYMWPLVVAAYLLMTASAACPNSSTVNLSSVNPFDGLSLSNPCC